jgi:hypothetical protein
MKTVPTTAEPSSPFNFAQHLIARNAARPDKIAFVDDQNVSRNHFSSDNAHFLAIAYDYGTRRGQVSQSL